MKNRAPETSILDAEHEKLGNRGRTNPRDEGEVNKNDWSQKFAFFFGPDQEMWVLNWNPTPKYSTQTCPWILTNCRMDNFSRGRSLSDTIRNKLWSSMRFRTTFLSIIRLCNLSCDFNNLDCHFKCYNTN